MIIRFFTGFLLTKSNNNKTKTQRNRLKKKTNLRKFNYELKYNGNSKHIYNTEIGTWE